MSNVDQLLAKAMSTSSEEEAIACLRMARKRGGPVSATSSTGDAAYWKNKAEHYYNMAVSMQNVARSAREIQEMWYTNYSKSEAQRRDLKSKKDKMEESLFFHKLAIAFLIPVCMMLLVTSL